MIWGGLHTLPANIAFANDFLFPRYKFLLFRMVSPTFLMRGLFLCLVTKNFVTHYILFIFLFNVIQSEAKNLNPSPKELQLHSRRTGDSSYRRNDNPLSFRAKRRISTPDQRNFNHTPQGPEIPPIVGMTIPCHSERSEESQPRIKGTSTTLPKDRRFLLSSE